MKGTDENELTKSELIREIVNVLNGVENIKIIEHFYLFIKKAVIVWR